MPVEHWTSGRLVLPVLAGLLLEALSEVGEGAGC